MRVAQKRKWLSSRETSGWTPQVFSFDFLLCHHSDIKVGDKNDQWKLGEVGKRYLSWMQGAQKDVWECFKRMYESVWEKKIKVAWENFSSVYESISVEFMTEFQSCVCVRESVSCTWECLRCSNDSAVQRTTNLCLSLDLHVVIKIVSFESLKKNETSTFIDIHLYFWSTHTHTTFLLSTLHLSDFSLSFLSLSLKPYCQ